MEKQLNLDAPFLSVSRVTTKLENSSELENTKKKKKTTTRTRRRKVKDSCQETEHETLVRLLQDALSFEHVMKPSSVPFLWEQTLVELKEEHHTLIEESVLLKALEMVSSTASFSASSTNGVSGEFEENGDRSRNVPRYDVTLEYRDLIMSRFLPAAKAMAMKEKKKKKKQNIALQRVSMAITQDLKSIDGDDDDDDDDDDYDHNHVDETVYSNDSKKAPFGFLPRFCSKDSLDVLNPVLSRVKTCQNLGVKHGKVINPKPQDSVCKTKAASLLPRILRSNNVLSKSQESYPIPRFASEVSKISLSRSGDIVRIPRNHSRLQRTASYNDQIQRQGTRFLAEEVKIMRSKNKNRSEKNLSVSQPPLPKTPSESWLCRTLPRSSVATTVVSGRFAVVGQATGLRKMEQKTNSQTIKWETIVKTSYKHHDHVRNSEEPTVVHPSSQHKP